MMNSKKKVARTVVEAILAYRAVGIFCGFFAEASFVYRYRLVFCSIFACIAVFIGEYEELTIMLRRIDNDKMKQLLVLFLTITSQRFIQFLFSRQEIIIKNQTGVDSYFSGLNALIVILDLVILTPLYEEFIFRFAVFHLVRSDKLAFFLSAFLFAFAHAGRSIPLNSIAGNLCVFLMYSVSGFTYSYLYKKTDNYWIPVLAHAIHNIFGTVSLLIE